MRRTSRWPASSFAQTTGIAAVLSLTVAAARADVFVLKDGDRVTGQISGETRTSILVRSLYGVLTIPRGRILRIIKDDGSDRAFSVPPDIVEGTSAPAAAPSAPRPRLVLVISGKSFWYAWDGKEVAVDPSVRFALSLDEDPLATYTDSVTEPNEIKGAMVNSFGFATAEGHPGTAEARPLTPEVQPGRVTLKIDLPGSATGDKQLRLAYQINLGTKAEPAWRDVTSTRVQVALKVGAPLILQVAQDQGQMDFARRKMKDVETFRLTAKAE